MLYRRPPMEGSAARRDDYLDLSSWEQFSQWVGIVASFRNDIFDFFEK